MEKSHGNLNLTFSYSHNRVISHSQAGADPEQRALLVDILTRLDAQLVTHLTWLFHSQLKLLRQAKSNGGSSNPQPTTQTSQSSQTPTGPEMHEAAQRRVKLSGFLFTYYRRLTTRYSHVLASIEGNDGDRHALFDSLVCVLGLVANITLLTSVSLDTIDQWIR